MIEIHEFSTGIHYEKTSQGGWRSRGFTGEFINKTLDPIPDAIEKAISNKEFAIAEGTVTDDRALVGREVSQNHQEWSVLAVIIRGVDEFGRHFPAYRYFYTKGRGNLDQLVHWWIGNKLVFNPFEPAEVRLYEVNKNKEIPLDNFQDLLEGKSPIIVPNDKSLSPLIIHAIAQKIAGENELAWAWNIGGLEYPKSFHAIYPDSLEAAELISKVISSQPASSGVIRGTHGIKLAIQNLMNQATVKTEYLETLETALSNPQIDDKLWHSYFDGKGVSQAISQQMYNPNMVRLLTLRAMILPSTLPEFLGWLQAPSQEKEHYQTSLNFQQEILKKISKNFPKLANKIIDGVKFIIPHLLDKPELLDHTIWLLGSNTSIWASLYFQEVKGKIEHDLSLMSDFARNKKNVKKQSKYNSSSSPDMATGETNEEGIKQNKDNLPSIPKTIKDKKNTEFTLVPEWEPIWQQIKGFWLFDQVKPLSQYLPLAKLFDQLGDYKISAVFYQIATGSVPNLVFKHVSNNAYKDTLFKLKVEKYVSKLELIWLGLMKFGGKIVPFYFVLIAGILGMVVGFFIRPIIVSENSKPKVISSPSPHLSKILKPSPIVSFKSLNAAQTLTDAGLKMSEAQSKIDSTYKALKELIKTKDKKDTLVKILNNTLENNKNKYSDLKDITLETQDLNTHTFEDDKIKEDWIKAIFLYQKDKNIRADGRISKTGETFQKLKNEIEKNPPSLKP